MIDENSDEMHETLTEIDCRRMPTPEMAMNRVQSAKFTTLIIKFIVQSHNTGS